MPARLSWVLVSWAAATLVACVIVRTTFALHSGGPGRAGPCERVERGSPRGARKGHARWRSQPAPRRGAGGRLVLDARRDARPRERRRRGSGILARPEVALSVVRARTRGSRRPSAIARSTSPPTSCSRGRPTTRPSGAEPRAHVGGRRAARARALAERLGTTVSAISSRALRLRRVRGRRPAGRPPRDVTRRR